MQKRRELNSSAIHHYFTLDKKWLVENRQMAFSLAAFRVGIKKGNIRRTRRGQGERRLSVHSPSKYRVLRKLAQVRGKAVSTVHVFVLPAPAGIRCIRCEPQGNSGSVVPGSTDECIVTVSCVDDLHEERTRSGDDRRKCGVLVCDGDLRLSF